MSTRGGPTLERLPTPSGRRARRSVRPRHRRVSTMREPLFERLDEVDGPRTVPTYRHWDRDHHPVRLLAPVAATILCVTAVWIIVAFWVWPSSSVQVSPLATHVPITLDVRVDPELSEVDTEVRAIPGTVVAAVSDGEMSMPTTGRRREPVAFAQGRITLRNRTREAVVAPRNTPVRTQQGTIFLTDAEVLVPPTVEIIGQTVPGEATVSVTAEHPGTTGNVRALAIVAVDGPAADILDVFNSQPITGAAEREIALVSERDVEELERVLLERLQSAAVEQLRRERPEQQTLVVWSPAAGNPEVMQREFSADVDQLAAVLQLELEVRARGTIFANDDLEQIIVSGLAAGGADVEFDEIHVLRTEVLDESFGRLDMRIEAVGESVATVDTDAIRAMLAGAGLEDGAVALNGLSQVASWRVTHDPPDTENFPRWGWRIDVQVTEPTAIPAG